MRTARLAKLVIFGALLQAAPALAQTATTTFQVRVTIQASCTVGSATNMDFGNQGVLASNIDQTSTFSVTCANGTPFNIGLDAGTFGGATVTTRRMSLAGTPVSYSLFRDAGRTSNWGNTVGTDTLASTGTGSAQAFTIYGRIPPQTTPGAGNYADTVTITVTY